MADRLHSAAPPTFSGGCGSVIGKRYRPGAVVGASVLLFGGPRSPGELAEAEQVRPPHYETHRPRSRALWSSLPLEAEDKRRMLLEASAKGTKILQQGRKRRVQSLTGALRSLNELGRDSRLLKFWNELCGSSTRG